MRRVVPPSARALQQYRSIGGGWWCQKQTQKKYLKSAWNNELSSTKDKETPRPPVHIHKYTQNAGPEIRIDIDTILDYIIDMHTSIHEKSWINLHRPSLEKSTRSTAPEWPCDNQGQISEDTAKRGWTIIEGGEYCNESWCWEPHFASNFEVVQTLSTFRYVFRLFDWNKEFFSDWNKENGR